jgi:hypothetical protein
MIILPDLDVVGKLGEAYVEETRNACHLKLGRYMGVPHGIYFAASVESAGKLTALECVCSASEKSSITLVRRALAEAADEES